MDENLSPVLAAQCQNAEGLAPEIGGAARFSAVTTGTTATTSFGKLWDHNNISSTKTSEEVDLVVVTTADLGFPRGATRWEIYRGALAIGFDLCPQDISFDRKKYSHFAWFVHPNLEKNRVGMALQPDYDPSGDGDLEGDSGFMFYESDDDLHVHFSGDFSWVFVRRRRK